MTMLLAKRRKKRNGKKEENPWMDRISIIIMLTVFLFVSQVWKS
ncbi:hypothetical protein bcere0029_52180 [Bacillus cereus AH1272]|nr:hypothetical protein bcere0029_52180 [Bacillus cereus AH1272]EEL93533.1 hypothetical protein bcere0030_23650 [Bacillus cereus AH1273]